MSALPPEIEKMLAACESRVHQDLQTIDESLLQLDGVVLDPIDPTADTSVVVHVEELGHAVKRARSESIGMLPIRLAVGTR